MTRRLLLAFGEAHLHGSAWVALACLVALLLPLTIALDTLGAVRHALLVRRVLAVTAMTCEGGCPPTPIGPGSVVRCSECGLAWIAVQNAFEPCPHAGCGAVAHLQCACGLPLASELHEEERW